MSLFIQNGKVYTCGKLIETNIFCENGKISELTSEKRNADTIVEAKGKVIIPGLIDPHVHFRDPGLTHKEDFFTGSCAAAAGGITTVYDMPNTIPPTTSVQALDVKRESAKKSIVNYGFHFGVAQDNLQEIKNSKLPSVKVFMDVTTGNLKIDDFSILKDVIESVQTTCFHAESNHIDVILDALHQAHSGQAYICHTSSADELARARAHLDLNNRVFVEVTPQHLFMTQDDIKDKGNFAQMKPTLKTKEDQKSLWEGIASGSVNTIGTDHAPHTKEEKAMSPFPYGITGEETMLPLLLNAMHEKKLSLSQIVSLCSTNTASIFGLSSKGKIEHGFDADLTIIDLSETKKVNNEKLFTKCKWSPFDGKLLKGWPVTTIVNGHVVFDHGEIHDIKAHEVTYGS